MTSPRIDHPEFAEFIRRFYGVSKPEPNAPHVQSQDRRDAPVAGADALPPTVKGAGRPGTPGNSSS